MILFDSTITVVSDSVIIITYAHIIMQLYDIIIKKIMTLVQSFAMYDSKITKMYIWMISEMNDSITIVIYITIV